MMGLERRAPRRRFVFCATIAAKGLGAAPLVSLAIAGQLLAALLLDQRGLVGFAPHPASWPRLAGLLLVAGGAAMVRLS